MRYLVTGASICEESLFDKTYKEKIESTFGIIKKAISIEIHAPRTIFLKEEVTMSKDILLSETLTMSFEEELEFVRNFYLKPKYTGYEVKKGSFIGYVVEVDSLEQVEEFRKLISEPITLQNGGNLEKQYKSMPQLFIYDCFIE